MSDTAIQTTAGVLKAEDGAGTVTVIRSDGSTFVDLDVTDHEGGSARVFLDYRQVAALMIALGAAAAEI